MVQIKWSGLGLAALLLASACGQQGSESPAADQAENAGANSGDTAAPAASTLGDAANSAASNSTDAAAGGPLSVYVGKHPSEVVNGTRFLDEPAVKAAVAANVPDAKIRDFVFNYSGPDAPIVAKAGNILAWGCEVHNCGYHNWSVSITPDGAEAEICFYHNDDSADGPSTWYLPGGKTEQRPGNCPSD